MDTPVSARKAERLETKETADACEQSFSAKTDMGNPFLVSAEDGAAVLDTGATANSVGFRWLAHHNRPLGQRGL